jgi:hypothetical protein
MANGTAAVSSSWVYLYNCQEGQGCTRVCAKGCGEKARLEKAFQSALLSAVGSLWRVIPWKNTHADKGACHADFFSLEFPGYSKKEAKCSKKY